MSMEEGVFLYRVLLHAADIAPGHKQGSAPVVANLANSRLAVRDLATVPTSKAPYPVKNKTRNPTRAPPQTTKSSGSWYSRRGAMTPP
jgi:hypothetical protein